MTEGYYELRGLCGALPYNRYELNYTGPLPYCMRHLQLYTHAIVSVLLPAVLQGYFASELDKCVRMTACEGKSTPICSLTQGLFPKTVTLSAKQMGFACMKHVGRRSRPISQNRSDLVAQAGCKIHAGTASLQRLLLAFTSPLTMNDLMLA